MSPMPDENQEMSREGGDSYRNVLAAEGEGCVTSKTAAEHAEPREVTWLKLAQQVGS